VLVQMRRGSLHRRASLSLSIYIYTGTYAYHICVYFAWFLTNVTQSNGGWTLIGKITSNFGWACPSSGGANCAGSSDPPAWGNFFDDSHTRSSVDLTVDPVGLTESGVHLPIPDIRELFGAGTQQELRLTFCDTGFAPKTDVRVRVIAEREVTAWNVCVSCLHACQGIFLARPHSQMLMNGNAANLFVSSAFSGLALSLDYTVTASPLSGLYGANLLCWAFNVSDNYRGYDQVRKRSNRMHCVTATTLSLFRAQAEVASVKFTTVHTGKKRGGWVGG
jgi:hypothetical protein